jgi:hypothetical protein
MSFREQGVLLLVFNARVRDARDNIEQLETIRAAQCNLTSATR